jgi:hypothetical protein
MHVVLLLSLRMPRKPFLCCRRRVHIVGVMLRGILGKGV